MKKLLAFLSIASLLFVSCEGDPGPPGPPGPPGDPGGDGAIGRVFEYNVTFTDLNAEIPSEIYDFPSGIDLYDTDVVVAYQLIDVIDGTDVWEPLPRTLYFNDGILMYGFNHTVSDIEFFLDGTVSFPTLDSFYTDAIIMRVAILPADLVGQIDVNDFNQVMSVSNFEIIDPEFIE